MVLAILVGIFHICLAMVVKCICYTKRFGFAKTISSWGWTLLIVGAVITGGLALLGVIDMPAVKIILIVLGIVLITVLTVMWIVNFIKWDRHNITLISVKEAVRMLHRCL